MPDQVSHLLHRAETEAVRSIQSPSAPAAAIHQELCLLYTGRALAALLARRRA